MTLINCIYCQKLAYFSLPYIFLYIFTRSYPKIFAILKNVDGYENISKKISESILTALPASKPTLVLLMLKGVGLFLSKKHLLRCWGWLSLLNWIGVLTLSLFLKLPPRKLEP